MSLRILITIFHDFLIFGLSFFVALWVRLDFANAFFLSQDLFEFLFLFSITNIFLLKYMGLYHGIWRYASLHEIISIIKSVSITTLALIGILFLIFRLENIPRSFPVLLFLISISSVISPRIFYRVFKDYFKKEKIKKIPVIVAGDTATAENFIRFTKQNNDSPYSVVALIGSKDSSVGRRIHNISIIASLNNVESLSNSFNKEINKAQRIIISDPNIKPELLESLYIFSKQNGLAIGMLPKVSEIKVKNEFIASPIVIEDVLGRKQRVNDPGILKDISGKIVMITGAGGSIGSELCKQVNRLNPKLLIMVEQNEYNLFKISSILKKNSVASLTDIKDTKKMEKLLSLYKPDYLFHAAALKHITFVEEEPLEALKTNFHATVKLCQLCMLLDIKKMIFISTDKAVNPSNVMGASKRLCEKYIQRISEKSNNTVFTIVRFGNVLGSTGSVVPLFEKQIREGGPLTITHPKVKRFFMTIREAVELVLISSQLNIRTNGEIFILEMGESILIKDLARKMIALSGKNEDDIKIEFTGLRKGEKLNEKLFFDNEVVSKTSVNGILSTNNKLFIPQIVEFNKFISAIENDKKLSVIENFEKLLPEYLKNE